jgi:septum site-determining protein MinC
MSESISIKGTREGLTITLGGGELAAIMEDLKRHLRTQGAFFRGGRVALQLADRAMPQGELEGLTTLLAEHDMILRTVMCSDPGTQAVATQLGLRVIAQHEVAAEPAEPAPSQADRSLDGSKGVLLRHMVRSGQIVRHTGHVIVLGDVNVGGEVIAGGDIVIWGRLYGTAHAGSMGNLAAVICALDMAPLQLRIGGYIARPGEEERRGRAVVPEKASVRDQAIVVEPWDKPSRGVF